MGATCTKQQQDPPEWDSRSPVQISCAKWVFVGTFGGRTRRVSTVIHVAKSQGSSQFNNEMAVMRQLGAHPHIVSLIHWGVSPHAGSSISDLGSYIALEDLRCELHSLVKHYMFAKETVPGPMARATAVDLSHAIDHMHSRQIVHRDIKLESVLMTKNHVVKLSDMGMACRLGLKEERWIWRAKEYRAFEVCKGNMKLGPAVDCWGIGIVLHQMYQFRWDMVDASGYELRLRPDRPSTSQPMDPNLLEAMVGLLRVSPWDRWSTRKIQDRIAPDRFPGYRDEWVKPICPGEESRRYLCRYRMTGAPVHAYVVVIDSKAKHLFGKTVDEIGLRRDDNVLLLLVDRPAPAPGGHVESSIRTILSASPPPPSPMVKPSPEKPILETIPNKDTVISEGCWLYFGLPDDCDTEATMARLERKLFPALCKDKASTRSVFVKPLTFALEFDCFTFPDHVPARSIIGQSKNSQVAQLSVRNRFALNLAGVARRGESEPNWFPGNLSEVGPGDLGLVVRWPRPGGRTEPTVTDEQLEPLMSPESFSRIMKEAPVYPEDELVFNI